jgi:hypothetical protein
MNKTLIHVDLSHNEFTQEACRLIGLGVKLNHSIYGLHMAGNGCMMDSVGHVRIPDAPPPIRSLLGQIQN